MAKKFEEDQLTELIVTIGSGLDKPLRIYIIGGFAMMRNNMKGSTKDIDVVFANHKDAKKFIKSAVQNGFHVDSSRDSEEYLQDLMLVLKDEEEHRFDIFVNRVLRGLVLTDSMRGRSHEVSIGKITANIASLEDIFLFKAITSRESDLDDMYLIARTGNLDWGTIVEEARNQPNHWIWVPRLYARLLDLEKKWKLRIPVVRNLEDEATTCQAMGLLLEKMQKKPLSLEDAMRVLHEEDEKFVESVLRMMVVFKLANARDGRFHSITSTPN